MSKIKDQTKKKTLSFARDRRNVYGECPTASRRNIARGTQRQHIDERRAVAHLLRQLNGRVDEDVASQVELQVKVTIDDSGNRVFKKIPDKPLGEAITRKLARKRRAT